MQPSTASWRAAMPARSILGTDRLMPSPRKGRRHIAKRFDRLPCVGHKGCFRFDLRGLAAQRFDQVHTYAAGARDVLPGAIEWLERNRMPLDNKYHASKFYLLAIVLPWIKVHDRGMDAWVAGAR